MSGYELMNSAPTHIHIDKLYTERIHWDVKYSRVIFLDRVNLSSCQFTLISRKSRTKLNVKLRLSSREKEFVKFHCIYLDFYAALSIKI